MNRVDNTLAELGVICSCDGCWACSGHVAGCTCDVDWDRMADERNDR